MTNLNKEWCIQEGWGISSGRGNVHLVKFIGGIICMSTCKKHCGPLDDNVDLAKFEWGIMSTYTKTSGGGGGGGDIVRTVMLAAQ